MLTGALLILAPLFLGFAIPISNRRAMTVIHYLVETLVYLILAMLGLGLGQMEGLGSQLGTMASQVFALVAVLLVCNTVGLWLFHRWRPMAIERTNVVASPGYRRLFMAAAQPLLAVLAGLLSGYYLLPALPFIDQAATALLMLLLLSIGLQLRNSGLSLRKLLTNVQGLGIALVLMTSSLLAGVLLIPVLGLPWHQVLALASGFGWYSLSGIVIGDAMGPAWGGVAFMNDVLREIIALAIIPLVITQRPALAIGYGGATTMDFTLPIIR
ncbi:MAG TPA: LysO family transporter, partial [Marinobacter sp.]|nr:LysO family transporter [Marinobacter sp.]